MTDSRTPLVNAITSAGTLAQRPLPSEVLVGSTYFSQDVPRLDLCVVTSPGVFAWRILDSGGSGIGGDPNALLFEDPTGTNAITNPRLVVEPPDVFGRPQIWDNRSLLGKGPVLRQGSWQADGDPSSQASEGFVTYGANALGLGPDNTQGGYGRIKARRMGLAQIIPGINAGALFYAIRLGTEVGDVDGIRMLDDTNDRTFDVTRSSGTITFGSGAGLGSARMFGNASGPLHSSNAGIQYSSLISNRAQLRANAYGAHAGVAGITGFKSRGGTIGALATISAGDVMFRATAIGVPGDGVSLNLAGLLSMQAAIIGATFVSTDLEVALATSTAGTRVDWTFQGETGDLIGGLAGGLVRENLGGATVGLGPTVVTWRPGAPDPLPPGVVTTWARVMAIISFLRGPVELAIDNSLAACVTDVGSFNFGGCDCTIVPAFASVLGGFAGPPVQMTIADGAELVDLAGGRGYMRLTGNGIAVSPLRWTNQSLSKTRMVAWSDRFNLHNIGAVALFGDALNHTWEMDAAVYSAAGGVRLAAIGPLGRWTLHARNGTAIPQDSIFTDATAVFNWSVDLTTGVTSQVAAASGIGVFPLDTFSLPSSGLAFGQTTLIAGVSPAISAPGLRAGSAVTWGLRDPRGDVLTVKYAALEADRVFGSSMAGSFKLSALTALDAVNGADTSILDWWAIL